MKNVRKKVVRRLGVQSVFLTLVVALSMVGCENSQEMREAQERASQQGPVPEAFVLPEPTSEEVLVISKQEVIEIRYLHSESLYDRDDKRYVRVTIRGGVPVRSAQMLLVKDFFRVFIQRASGSAGSASCVFQIRSGDFAGTVFNMEEVEEYVENGSVAKMCGAWEYASNITAIGPIFAYELTDQTPVQVRIRMPVEVKKNTTLGALKDQGAKWRVYRASRSSALPFRVYRVSTIDSRDMQTSVKGAETTRDAVGVLRVALQDMQTPLDVLAGLRHEEDAPIMIKNAKDLHAWVREMSSDYRWALRWFKKLPSPVQTLVLTSLRPLLVKLGVRIVPRELLERYLIELEWERDIATVNPHWERNWKQMQSDLNEPVLYFNNLSYWDVWFRLWWSRRTEAQFESFKVAMAEAMAENQS